MTHTERDKRYEELLKVLKDIMPYLEMKLGGKDLKRLKGVMGEPS